MNPTILQLVTAFLGALGFSLLFGMRRRYLLAAALGGVLSWGVYLLVDAWLHVSFFSYLLASIVAVTYSELMARPLKTPATLFVVPGIIVLVPGSSLYYAMDSAVRGDMEAARSFGSHTLVAALAIAAGISFVVVFRELHTRQR